MDNMEELVPIKNLMPVIFFSLWFCYLVRTYLLLENLPCLYRLVTCKIVLKTNMKKKCNKIV